MFPAAVSRALLACALAMLVLSTHAYSSIERVRAKLVRSPQSAEAGVVEVSATSGLDALHPPFALIARVHNGATSPAAFAIEVDGAPVCDRTVPAGRTERVDCAVTAAWAAGASHRVRITGPSAPWTLDYLELATHHGNLTEPAEVFVLPKASTRYTPVPWPVALLLSLLLLAVMQSPRPPPLPALVRYPYRFLIGVAFALLIAVEAADRVSDYRLVLSGATFVKWLVLLQLPRVYVAVRWWMRRARPDEATWARRLRIALVPVIVLGAYFSIVQTRIANSATGNYSTLLQIARQNFDRNPLLNHRDDVRRSLDLADGGGYDGQFLYFEAFDPFLRAYRSTPAMYRLFIDAPPYRYSRIGFSLLAIAASLGRWQWLPAAMTWLVLVGLSVLGFLLALRAREEGRAAALGALVILIPGFWQSVQTSLPEPVAAAALVGGLMCLQRRRWVPAAALLAVSLLVRETGIIAIACALVGAVMAVRTWRPVAVVGVAVGALVAWRIYVAWVLFPDWGIEGLLFHPPDLTWPVAGIVDLWKEVLQGRYYPDVPELGRAAVAFPALLIGGFVLAVVLAITQPGVFSVAACGYGLLAISLNLEAIWVHVANGQRGTYELFLMLALASISVTTARPWLRRAVTAFWSMSALYVFVLGFDAVDIRMALPFPF
jgi:hypothetical protein